MMIYIDNLPSDTNSEDLKMMFAAFGCVKNATVATDGKTDRSMGFGFVEMPISTEAGLAIDTLKGKHLDRQDIKPDPILQSQKNNCVAMDANK